MMTTTTPPGYGYTVYTHRAEKDGVVDAAGGRPWR